MGPVVTGTDPRRCGAVADPWPVRVYAGAPFVRQLSTGPTLLSCQSTQGHTAPQMVVDIGDAQARHFSGRSVPFDLPDHVAGEWNSLFVKDAQTVTALTSARLQGSAGIWAIDGQVYTAEETAPAKP